LKEAAMENLRSVALTNPMSIFVVVIGVFMFLGALGRVAARFAS
jgi:hypothetical protein